MATATLKEINVKNFNAIGTSPDNLLLPIFDKETGELKTAYGQYNVKVIGSEYAECMAKLHIEGISTGFISSLGLGFVSALYKALAEHKNCLGILDESGELLGFAAFTQNVGGLYKSILKKNLIKFLLLLAGKLLSFSRIKKVLETLLYPKKTDELDLPSAELLSIVVSPKARRMSLGKKLVNAGFDHCREQGIDKVKVLVYSENEGANRLYQSCDFDFITQVDSHGLASNIYVKDIECNRIRNEAEVKMDICEVFFE